MSDRTPDHPGTEASVVITTKNRREAVLRAVRSAVDQSGAIEVIVIDDGSTDGTSEAIQTAHPEVRLIRCDVSEGFVRQRNRGAAIATAPIVISLDDDAVFDGPDVVRGTLREFTDPRIAAVHMPAAGARTTERPHAVACFVGWAHAVRRDAFFAVGATAASCAAMGRSATSASACCSGGSSSSRGGRAA
jgi:glycosyltransferase involved in cell wall biosynthesis